MSARVNDFFLYTQRLQSHHERWQRPVALDPLHALFVLQARGRQPALEMDRVPPTLHAAHVLFEQRVKALNRIGRREEPAELGREPEPMKREQVVLGLQEALEGRGIVFPQAALQGVCTLECLRKITCLADGPEQRCRLFALLLGENVVEIAPLVHETSHADSSAFFRIARLVLLVESLVEPAAAVDDEEQFTLRKPPALQIVEQVAARRGVLGGALVDSQHVFAPVRTHAERDDAAELREALAVDEDGNDPKFRQASCAKLFELLLRALHPGARHRALAESKARPDLRQALCVIALADMPEALLEDLLVEAGGILEAGVGLEHFLSLGSADAWLDDSDSLAAQTDRTPLGRPAVILAVAASVERAADRLDLLFAQSQKLFDRRRQQCRYQRVLRVEHYALLVAWYCPALELGVTYGDHFTTGLALLIGQIYVCRHVGWFPYLAGVCRSDRLSFLSATCRKSEPLNFKFQLSLGRGRVGTEDVLINNQTNGANGNPLTQYVDTPSNGFNLVDSSYYYNLTANEIINGVSVSSSAIFSINDFSVSSFGVFQETGQAGTTPPAALLLGWQNATSILIFNGDPVASVTGVQIYRSVNGGVPQSWKNIPFSSPVSSNVSSNEIATLSAPLSQISNLPSGANYYYDYGFEDTTVQAGSTYCYYYRGLFSDGGSSPFSPVGCVTTMPVAYSVL